MSGLFPSITAPVPGFELEADEAMETWRTPASPVPPPRPVGVQAPTRPAQVPAIPTPVLPPNAACLDSDAEFFVTKAPGRATHAVEAKRTCVRCPALVECLTSSFERGEAFDFGIWGGAGGELRRWLGRVWRGRHRDPDGWERALAGHIEALDAFAAGENHQVLNRNGPGATCGLRVTYNRGCRCFSCRWAASDDTARTRARRSAA